MKIIVDSTNDGARLDRFLSRQTPELSRSSLQRMIKNGGVDVNGEVVNTPKTIVKTGDEITLDLSPDDPPSVDPEDIPLSILFEDEFLLIVDKPAGMVVHPAAGISSGTLVNALMARDPAFADAQRWAEDGDEWPRPGVVHRLDRDTSGCLVVAKTPEIRKRLTTLFANREVRKTYLALVKGHPAPASDEITTPFGRHPVNRKKMAVLKEGGRLAITRYETVAAGAAKGEPISLLRVRILTGRTHQIRVHMAWLKTPVLGDQIYGGRQSIRVPRQMLHAHRLALTHPATKSELDVESPLPDDIVDALRRFDGGAPYILTNNANTSVPQPCTTR